MSTKAQILANRLNAQKSTGPSPPEGKAIASQTSVKHGLSATRDIISVEDQADFDLYREDFFAELYPISPMESMLADRIVSLSWRLKRLYSIQNQTIDALATPDTSSPVAKLLSRLPTQPDPSDSETDLTLGRLAVKDFSNTRVLERLLMYERRIENSLYKTYLEFQRLKLIQNLKPEP